MLTTAGAEFRFIPAGAGNTRSSVECRRIDRFIPAGAGNFTPLRPARSGGSVHPRGRREHPSPGYDA